MLARSFGTILNQHQTLLTIDGICGRNGETVDIFIAALLAFGLDARILLLGLLGYLLSVFCWYKTLHKLALSKAYALLSMSYVLVWIASMVLPGWEGTFSLKALLGVACIMSGLMLIFLPTTKQRY